MIGNTASGERGTEGVGGGIALSERCIDGVCTRVTATLSSMNISGNAAAVAGGGILYRGANLNSSFTLHDSLVAANAIVGQGATGAGGAQIDWFRGSVPPAGCVKQLALCVTSTFASCPLLLQAASTSGGATLICTTPHSLAILPTMAVGPFSRPTSPTAPQLPS